MSGQVCTLRMTIGHQDGLWHQILGGRISGPTGIPCSSRLHEGSCRSERIRAGVQMGKSRLQIVAVTEAEDPRAWNPDGGNGTMGRGKLKSALAAAWTRTTAADDEAEEAQDE